MYPDGVPFGFDNLVERNLERKMDSKATYDKVLLLLNEYKPESVLEIGSFPFVFTKKLIDNGFNVSGVDIKVSSKNMNTFRCDIELEDLPFSDNSFDFVLMMDVFEHLIRDPLRSVRGINEVLKNNGTFVITTPNFFALNNLISLLFRGKTVLSVGETLKVGRGSFGYMGHFREYTKNEMIEILNICGFRVTDMYFVFGVERNNLLGYVITKMFPFLRNEMIFVCKKI